MSPLENTKIDKDDAIKASKKKTSVPTPNKDDDRDTGEDINMDIGEEDGFDDNHDDEDDYDDEFTRQFSEEKTFSKKMDSEDAIYLDQWRERKKYKTEDSSTVEGVLDLATSKVVYQLINKQWIKGLGGIISTGKESNVYFAYSNNLEATQNIKNLAMKIYRTSTLDFKKIKSYILGDRRFQRKVGKKSHQIIGQWAQKEFSNLQRAREAGVSVPQPLTVRRNVLLMEFIGYEFDINTMPQAAPILQKLQKDPIFLEHANTLYESIVNDLNLLWNKASIVHGDLSEYNILGLVVNNIIKYYIIDISQGLLTSHPAAQTLLLRDIQNINNFFGNLLTEVDLKDDNSIFEKITGLKASEAIIVEI